MNHPNNSSNNNFDEHDYGVDGGGDRTKARSSSATGSNDDDKLESEKDPEGGKRQFPVTYSVSWNSSTPAMTITLLVPTRHSSTAATPLEGDFNINSDTGTLESPFTKMEEKEDDEEENGEVKTERETKKNVKNES
eukprot:5973726-Ditylum_brightwellii.AAC.1